MERFKVIHIVNWLLSSDFVLSLLTKITYIEMLQKMKTKLTPQYVLHKTKKEQSR